MKVFVYGTLKKNCPSYHMLQNRDNGKAEFICDATTKKLFPLILATQHDLPFMLDRSGIGNHVIGEVYSVDEKMLAALDKFEGHPLTYKRRVEMVIPVNGQGDKALSAWIYLFHSFNEALLKETFYDTYVCNNYDFLLSFTSNSTKEELDELLKKMRDELTAN